MLGLNSESGSGLGLELGCIKYIKLLIQYIKLSIQYNVYWVALLCRSQLNGAAEKKIAAYSCFWPQNQSNSYFDLCQKHEETSPQNKFSRLVLTGTIYGITIPE